MINFLIRPEKVKELIELISNDKKMKNVIMAIYL